MQSIDVERRRDGAFDSLIKRVVFISDNELLTKGFSCVGIFALMQNHLVHYIRFYGVMAYCVPLNDGGGGGGWQRLDDGFDDDGYYDEVREVILVHGDA